MKYVLALSFSMLLVCGCTAFDAKPPDPDQSGLPVGKNWQITEEPVHLSNESGRLPFQMEQSVQPEAPKPQLPTENRTVKTPL